MKHIPTYFGHGEIPMPVPATATTQAVCPVCGALPALRVAGALVPGYLVVGDRAFGLCGCSRPDADHE